MHADDSLQPSLPFEHRLQVAGHGCRQQYAQPAQQAEAQRQQGADG